MTEPEQDPTTPEGRAAMEAAAAQKDPNPRVAANALAYFMGEAPPPGSDKTFPLAVDFGPLGEPNFQPCTFRQLSNEQLVKCEELATVKNDAGQIERIDPFTRWSYIYAYASVEPDLGKALEARRAHGENLPDTAAIVREVFRYQPGVLQQVVYKIEERSRLGQDSQQAVREVEAGKDSS